MEKYTNFQKKQKDLNILFDFFKILKEGTNIKEVLNKYFTLVIGKELPSSIKINNVDELFYFINKSKYFKNKKYNYFILLNYFKEIETKNKMEKNVKRKNNNKMSKRINISDTEATSTHNSPKKEEKKKTNLKDKNPKNIGITPLKPIKRTFNINETEKKFNIPKEIINYFKERTQYYPKKGYKTHILDELIKAIVKIDKNLFVLKKTANDNISSYLAFNFKNLKDKIDELEKEISSIKVKNNEIEINVKSLTEKNSNLETNIKELTLVVTELRKKVNALEQFKNDNENIIKENKNFKRKLFNKNK